MRDNDHKGITESWYREIYEMQEFFESVALPVAPVRLNVCTVIVDPVKFIASHIEVVKANRGNRTFEPHLERLLQLKSILSHAEKEMSYGESQYVGKEGQLLFEIPTITGNNFRNRVA